MILGSALSGFLADVSGQSIGPVVKGQRNALTFEDWTVMLSRNVGKKVHFTLREILKEPKSQGPHIVVESYHTCLVMGQSRVQISAVRLGILSYEMKHSNEFD